MDELTQEQRKAFDFCLKMERGQVAFIDGPAGVGKSFLIDRIHDALPKLLLCAPTGRAASNIGGCTIHKLFLLPADLVFDPSWQHRDLQRYLFGELGKSACRYFNKKRLEPLKYAQGIVIDEISMVRCDIWDFIDCRLRHVLCEPHVAFGGMRMILSGDEGQLQSVVTEDDAKALDKLGYKHPYGFRQAKVFL